MGRRLPLWFSALFLFTACKTMLPLRPKGGNGGDARSGLATVVVEIDNEQVLKSELGDKLTGYRFVVQPLEGTVCATSSKIDRTEAWDVHDFREDLIANCDYRVGIEIGTLNADGTKLAAVAYSNLDGTQRGYTVLSSYLKPETILEVNFSLSKAVPPSDPTSNPGDTPVPPTPDDKVIDRGREVMGYYLNGDSATGNSLNTLKTYHNHLSGIIPQWFNLKANGTLESANGGIKDEPLNIARKELLKIVPFVFVDQVNVGVLTDPLTRSTAVNNIVEMVREQHFHGVNMFAARVAKEEKAMFTAFMDELAAKLREENKLLMLLVYPKTGVDESVNGVYDYKALGEIVDRLIIMTYDRHFATSKPGPIAPAPWVEENIQKLLQEDQVPPEKILLGLADYGYDWPASGAGTMLSEKKAFETAAQFKAEFEWDDTAQVPFVKYTDAGKGHTIYLENSYSATFKFQMVQKYNLKGVAIWRLGGETDRFWVMLKEVLKI